jgi:hypothetical protein
MANKVSLSLIISSALLLLLSNCDPNFGVANMAKIDLVAVKVVPPSGAASISVVDNSAGTNTAAGLDSLLYYINWIRLLPTEDSGNGLWIYSKPQPEEYENPNDWYDAFDTDVARTHIADFTDVTDQTSLDTLSSNYPVDSEYIGTYTRANLGVMRTIIAEGAVTLGDGTIVYTKDGDVAWDTVKEFWQTTCSDMTTGPAEPAYMMQNTGDNTFYFLKPLEVTQADIDANITFEMLLIFNPDSMITGGKVDSYFSLAQIVDSAAYGLYIPPIDVIPIVYRSGSVVIRETYRFDVPSGTYNNPFMARFEIYTLDDDTSNIYAVSLRYYVDPQDGNIQPRGFRIDAVDQTGDIYSFTSGNSSINVITDFSRLSTVNETSTATVYFNQEYNGTDPVSITNVTYTLIESNAIN